jgi:hypothetical protein
MGAPRGKHSQPKPRSNFNDSRAPQSRLRPGTVQWLSILTMFLRMWQALPSGVRAEILRLLHLS